MEFTIPKAIVECNIKVVEKWDPYKFAAFNIKIVEFKIKIVGFFIKVFDFNIKVVGFIIKVVNFNIKVVE